MKNNTFDHVKCALYSRIPEVLELMLPEGKIIGKEYVCSGISGGLGKSCKTDINTGVGSDFSTGESWGDVIALTALINKSSQLDAALFLAEMFNIDTDNNSLVDHQKLEPDNSEYLTEQIITPVPESAPLLPTKYKKGILNCYKDKTGQTLCYIVRIDKTDGKKAFFPVCLCKTSKETYEWRKKAPPEPRSLYRCEYLRNSRADTPVLILEGEKTAEAAARIFPDHICISWMGGANAVHKSDWSLIADREVTIWPDNDDAGIKASLEIADILQEKYSNIAKLTPLPDTLPAKWDVADPVPKGIDLNELLRKALCKEEIRKALGNSTINRATQVEEPQAEETELNLPEWPMLSKEALHGFAGDFVYLATRESEGDPAAVLITLLVRFAAEIYGYETGRGAFIRIGDTKHVPRIFAVVCGNSSKARKGTSSHPITKLFKRDLCDPKQLAELNLPPSARVSGGPLSSGEGLGFQLCDNRTDENNNDKRLYIQDEELASGLSCTKRDGNTLSMAIRVFWDGGIYAPITKSNQVKVTGAHLCIVSHITQSELSNLFTTVQMSNGFGNRFLWVCAKRHKLVAFPRPMPKSELAPLQLRLWKLVKDAQTTGEVTLTPKGIQRWYEVYPELTKEHQGLFGAITARAEAQTIRLSLIYALLDGAKEIDEQHINSALALWNYASDSARVLFHDRAIDPLEQKILSLLKIGSLTATELSNAFNRNIQREKLQGVLIKLESSNQIKVTKESTKGRPVTRLSLYENTK